MFNDVFNEAPKLNRVDQQFYLARGREANCADVTTLEMTKWFDSNYYYYLVPELNSAQQFKADFSDLLAQVKHAKNLNQALKVVMSGLLTFLLLVSYSHV